VAKSKEGNWCPQLLPWAVDRYLGKDWGLKKPLLSSSKGSLQEPITVVVTSSKTCCVLE
jgi:hypothetical protein